MLVIVGAGAVGTVLAGYLSAGAKPVRLVCREAEIEGLAAADAITINRVTGGPPLTADKPLLATRVDVEDVRYLFICVKNPDLQSVLDALPTTLPKDLLIVSTLSGVGGVQRIREHFPGQGVIPASILFNAQLLEPLHARITTRPQVLMPFDNADLVEYFRGSGVRLIRANGEAAAWGKLVFNLANAIGAATRATFHRILTDSVLRLIYADLLAESAAALDRAGIRHDLPAPVPLSVYIALLRHGGPLPWWLARWRSGISDTAYSSMLSDIQHGRSTEVDYLNGEIVALARKQGADAPCNAALVDIIHAMERERPYAPMTPEALRDRIYAVAQP